MSPLLTYPSTYLGSTKEVKWVALLFLWCEWAANNVLHVCVCVCCARGRTWVCVYLSVRIPGNTCMFPELHSAKPPFCTVFPTSDTLIPGCSCGLYGLLIIIACIMDSLVTSSDLRYLNFGSTRQGISGRYKSPAIPYVYDSPPHNACPASRTCQSRLHRPTIPWEEYHRFVWALACIRCHQWLN